MLFLRFFLQTGRLYRGYTRYRQLRHGHKLRKPLEEDNWKTVYSNPSEGRKQGQTFIIQLHYNSSLSLVYFFFLHMPIEK
jgi:hypothetical protein